MKRLLFKGTVQGVGFRTTARKIAKNLELTIEATNLPSGDVEIIIENTSPEKEKKLIEELHSRFHITSVIHS